MTKAILALDGGGVRGVVSIAFLERIEAILSEAAGRPVLLAEYFDLIGGTSTGAIIAAGLALGTPASEVKRYYFHLGPKVFRKSRLRLPGLAPVFDAAMLKQELLDSFGERTLESADLRTGLAVVAKRIDTASAWLLTNNPRAKFWNDPPDQSFIGNRHFRLADVVRASAAAPHYFAPEAISIAEGQKPGLFVDGGVTTHNNPSLALLQIATIPAYGYSWPTGADDMLIVSVGTGIIERKTAPKAGSRLRTIQTALTALVGMIEEVSLQVLGLMQVLGRTDTPWRINSEVGDFGGFTISKQPMFTFQRYDIRFEARWLRDELGIDVGASDLARMQQLGEAAMMPRSYEIAKAAAERFIKPEHLRLLTQRGPRR